VDGFGLVLLGSLKKRGRVMNECTYLTTCQSGFNVVYVWLAVNLLQRLLFFTMVTRPIAGEIYRGLITRTTKLLRSCRVT
jgi:hypothetical protein